MSEGTAPAAGAPPIPPLRATYRLQLHGGFRLADATAVVAYLERLGVSHLYASPILRARAGSTHGYDVADPDALNPELGDERDRQALLAALRAGGMGLLLDIVPNHMAASLENPYWQDVLAHGRASRWAHWFDVDWQGADPELQGRVLLPVLGDWQGEVLARGELTVCHDDGRVHLCYFEHRFPVDPRTAPWVLGLGLDGARESATPADRADLDELAALLDRLEALPPRSRRDAASMIVRAEESEAVASALAALVRRSAAVRAHVEAATAAFGAGEVGATRMRRFLARQPHALVYWRRAGREINYRRFFNINELVALRMEDPAVFDETHRLVLRWVADGGVDGLRLDHVDGLRDPLAYLQRLRAAVDARRPGAGAEARFPLLVEKILTAGEQLRPEWPVEGTTGYEVLNDLEELFVDAAGFDRLERRYRALLHLDRRGVTFHDIARESKRKVLGGSLSADVQRLVRLLAPVALRDPRTTALDAAALTTAVVEVLAELPVYRTYVDDLPRPPAHDDVERVARTIAAVRERGAADAGALDLLREVLLLEGVERQPPEDAAARRRFASRFQQVSGPAAAKGVEDTALYLYLPLASRNEVGGEPDRPLADAVERLHAGNARRRRDWPRALVTVSTHDTKRGPDTRARLDVLSELPEEWWRLTTRWRRRHLGHRGRVGRRWAPDPNTEYLLYQTLVGIWPVAPAEGGDAHGVPDEAALGELRERVHAYMEKAVREGKSRSGWIDQDPAFEGALRAFTDALLDPARSAEFLRELGEFARRIARPGYWNALSRMLLHLTVPGVPDVYQGDELWSFTLVDPDNRRPVDFARRAGWLEAMAARAPQGDAEAAAALQRELLAAPDDGRVKLWLLWRLLRVRRAHPRLFGEGSYEPLAAEGGRAAHVVAFVRRLEGVADREGRGPTAALVVAPRLTAALAGGDAPVGEASWQDTALVLPPALAGARWRCALTGRDVPVDAHGDGGRLRLGAALADFPVSLLLAQQSPPAASA